MTIIVDGGEAFATTDDVATRLGRSLTEAEEAQAQVVLEAVGGLIRDAAGKASSWLPDPIPVLLFALSLEKTVNAIVNPHNLAATSEQLGSYQRSQTFPRSLDVGVFLTEAERRQVRRACGAAGSGSVPLRSLANELDPYDQ